MVSLYSGYPASNTVTTVYSFEQKNLSINILHTCILKLISKPKFIKLVIINEYMHPSNTFVKQFTNTLIIKINVST